MKSSENRSSEPTVRTRTISAAGAGGEPSSYAIALDALVQLVGKRHSLTAREMDVLRLAATGLHTKAVAAELGCSSKTVEEYWRRMLRKTAICSRQVLVAELLAEAIMLRTNGVSK